MAVEEEVTVGVAAAAATIDESGRRGGGGGGHGGQGAYGHGRRRGGHHGKYSKNSHRPDNGRHSEWIWHDGYKSGERTIRPDGSGQQQEPDETFRGGDVGLLHDSADHPYPTPGSTQRRSYNGGGRYNNDMELDTEEE